MKKKDIFYYTKRKIIIISMVIVFLSLFIFSLITQFLYSSRLFNSIDKQLIQQKQMISSVPPNVVDERMPQIPMEMLMPNPPPIAANFIVSVYEGNNLVTITPNSYFTKDNISSLPKVSGNGIENVQYKNYNFRGIRFKQFNYDIQLLVNIDSELQSLKQLSNAIILSLIMLVLIALVLSVFLAAKVIKPVKEAYDKQVFFVQDASHEMRTPLAVIKGKLEILANSWGETIDENFEHISKMMSEVRGLEKLDNDLLLLTKEDLDVSINAAKFSLEQFLDDIGDFYVDLAEMQNKYFQIIRLDSEVMVQWDYDKMKRVAVILLENAFKYTPAEGRIILKAEDMSKHIKITISDTGIGIKQEEQARIFDRFFRSSDVRTQNINGSGIGLSLLKSISKTLGITIKFSSSYGEGTEFTILVPKKM